MSGGDFVLIYIISHLHLQKSQDSSHLCNSKHSIFYPLSMKTKYLLCHTGINLNRGGQIIL